MTQTAVASEQLRRYVETHHIDRIPDGARHGKPWQQFAFWWGGYADAPGGEQPRRPAALARLAAAVARRVRLARAGRR
jgi:hypothetical protein